MGIFGPPNIRKMKAKKDIKGLIKAFSRWKDYEIYSDAGKALIAIGTPAVEPLIAALQDRNYRVREGAASTLGKIKDKRAVEPLLAALKSEDPGFVRNASAWALTNFDDVRAVEPLIDALKGEAGPARVAGAVLGVFGDPRAADALIAAIKNDPDGSYIYAGSLGKMGDIRAIEPLIDNLNNSNLFIRSGAASMLGKLGDIRAVDSLLAMLKDKEKEVRSSAAEALGKIGDTRAVEPLITILNDNEKVVSSAAAKALEIFGDPRAVNALEKNRGIVIEEKRNTLKIEIEQFKSQGNVSGLIGMLEKKELDYEMERQVKDTLMDLGINAMVGLLLALGDNQRTIAFNHLKQEGRLNDNLLRMGIGRAATDYRNKFAGKP